jgi:hypothetical protein
MLEMIQQHTVPQTENWNVVTPMVERAREMVKHSKDAAALTIEGWDTTTADGKGNGKDRGSQNARANGSAAAPSQDAKQSSSKKRAIVDNSPGSASTSVPKRVKKLRIRKGGDDGDSTNAQEKGDSNNDYKKPIVEFEDISAEVDATLREKEERRRRKAEKKRRRESGGSVITSAASGNGGGASPAVVEKPRKKMKKDSVDADAGNGIGEAKKPEKKGGREKEKEKGAGGENIDTEKGEDEDTEVRTKKKRKRD